MRRLSNARHDTSPRIINLLPANIPDALNAGLYYEKAVESLGPFEKQPDWFQKSSNPSLKIDRKTSSEFLAQHKSVISLFHHATSFPGYSLDVDVTNLYNRSYRDSHDYRAIILLAGLSARIDALNNNINGVMNHIKALEKMEKHLIDYPQLIEFSYARIFEQTINQVLEYALSFPLNNMTIHIGKPIIAQQSVLKKFLKMTCIQKLCSHQAFAEQAEGNVQDIAEMYPRSRNGINFSTWIWRAFFLPRELDCFMNDIEKIRTLKPNYTDFEEYLYFIKQRDEKDLEVHFLLLHFPAFPWVKQSMIIDAQRGLRDLALALTAFNTVYNKYPSRLNILTPNFIDRIPMDPFDRKPLKMEPIEGGLKLYSVSRHPKNPELKAKTPIDFYLGKEAYDKYRANLANEK